jgi:hypothetical protein
MLTSIRILSRCPNIEMLIDFSCTTRNYFEEICKASERGACKVLREPPYFVDTNNAYTNRKYLEGVYSLRDSLQCMALNESYLVNSNITTTSLLQNLDELPQLRRLDLGNR